MKFIYERVYEGAEPPRFYGIAYHDYYRRYAIAYPVPINLIVRFARFAWHELIRHRVSRLDTLLQEAYLRGQSDAMKHIDARIEEHAAWRH